MDFTAVYLKVPEGFVAFVEELPGANTQGATLDEARENLKEAVAMILEANRELAEREIAGKSVVKEEILVTSRLSAAICCDTLKHIVADCFLGEAGIPPPATPP